MGSSYHPYWWISVIMFSIIMCGAKYKSGLYQPGVDLLSESFNCGFVILIRMEIYFSFSSLIMSTLIDRLGVQLPSYMELLGRNALKNFIGPWWKHPKRSS